MRNIAYKISFIISLAFIFGSCSQGEGLISNDKSAANGEGGSMARMAIVGDYLYTVDDSDLKVFDISTPTQVQYISTSNVGREIETIFGFKNSLYIGSGTAVYIYDISDPANPTQLEMIEHTYSCDPVVANDTIALSTIRSTSACRRGGWWANELILMDVSKVSNIHETHSYQLDYAPFGIGLEDTVFFMCKGELGIDIYDVRDFYDPAYNWSLPPTINTIPNIDAFDVIPYNNLLIVVSESGMELYDISDIQNIQKLSGIYPD